MKLKDLINNEKFLSKYGDYEIVGDSYTTVLQDGKSQLVFDVQKPKPKSVWELKEGDIYFVLYTDGDMTDYEWKRDGGISKGYRDQGNVFITKEEAKKEAERREVETLLLKYGGRRWFKHDIENWAIRYNYITGSFECGFSKCAKHQGCIYFDTKEEAMKAVNEIGKERIKEALFEVR